MVLAIGELGWGWVRRMQEMTAAVTMDEYGGICFLREHCRTGRWAVQPAREIQFV